MQGASANYSDPICQSFTSTRLKETTAAMPFALHPKARRWSVAPDHDTPERTCARTRFLSKMLQLSRRNLSCSYASWKSSVWKLVRVVRASLLFRNFRDLLLLNPETHKSLGVHDICCFCKHSLHNINSSLIKKNLTYTDSQIKKISFVFNPPFWLSFSLQTEWTCNCCATY